MAVSRYSGTLKRRTNILTNITPTPVVNRNPENPPGEWMPSAWLPIEWTDSVTEDSFVMSSGKVVALDATGRVCPAGYRLRQTAAGVFVTYTATDIAEGVIDISTGAVVATAGTRTGQVVAEGLLAQGLVNETELALGIAFNGALDAHVTAVIEAFISLPIGILVGDTYVWAGDFPDYTHHNYSKQHLIQFVTELVMKVPHLANATAGRTEDLNDGVAVPAWGGGTQFPDAGVVGSSLYVSTTQLATLARYSGLITAADTVTGYALYDDDGGADGVPWCKNTSRTPLTDSAGTVCVNEKSSIAQVIAGSAGDFYWDAAVGMLFLHTAANTRVATPTDIIAYYYDGGSATAHRMIHMTGEARPGQFLTVDDDSNFAAVEIVPGTTNMGGIVGRVLSIIAEPKGLLDRVETAWSGSNMTAREQMPGTASGGYTDLITFSDETVADQVAILNIKIS